MRVLVIVESFTKEKTVHKYLTQAFKGSGNTYTVKASGGHVCDLVKKDMGIDPKTIEPVYQIMKDKGKLVTQLKKLVKEHDITLLAADNDREGEAIAWHLLNVLKPNNYRRIVFNEITQNALHRAVNQPREIDKQMVDSQQARRVLDRLVGYRVTKVLWDHFTGGGLLSAGRVQSVVLRLIVDKEASIKEFKSDQYWNVLGTFMNGVKEAKLCDNKSSGVFKFDDKEKVISFLKPLAVTTKYTVGGVETKPLLEYPDKPFTTSTLQQKAHSRGFSIKQTMKVAQELYELGHITYMRTDSTALSKEFQNLAKGHINQTFGASYIGSEERLVKQSQQKVKNAQEAHEAIRPTRLVRDVQGLNSKQKSLYQLIFSRSVAALMIPAKYMDLTMRIENEHLQKLGLHFKGKAKQLIEPGYLKAYEEKSVNTENKELFKNIDMKSKTTSSIEIRGNCIWSAPPARYSESTIIKAMEDMGIGRPSTYVSMVNKLYQRMFVRNTDVSGEMREYVDYVIKDKGKIKIEKETKEAHSERSKLVPTEAGIRVDGFLREKFKDVINADFTSKMELILDDISEGKETYQNIVLPFYGKFKSKCESLSQSVKKSEKGKEDIAPDANEFTIDGKKIVVRVARYGPVIEIKNEETRSQYINLDPFMKLIGESDLANITKKHIKFLMSFPKKYKEFTINYKAYGFYITDANNNSKSINYRNYAEFILKDDFSFIESMKPIEKKEFTKSKDKSKPRPKTAKS